MENVPAKAELPRPHRRRTLTAVSAVLVAIGGSFGVFHFIRSSTGSLTTAVSKKIPSLDLYVALSDVEQKSFEGPTRLSLKGHGALEKLYKDCANPLVRGDSPDNTFEGQRATPLPVASPTQVGAGKEKPDAHPDPCQTRVRWNLVRHPVALSLEVRNGQGLNEWMKSNEALNRRLPQAVAFC